MGYLVANEGKAPLLQQFFTKASTPHQEYARRLKQSGLANSGFGKFWLAVGQEALKDTVTQELPWRETGYFELAEIRAVSVRFSAKDGENIAAKMAITGGTKGQVFLDLYKMDDRPDRPPRHVAATDSGGLALSYLIRSDGDYLLRVQPELSKSFSYDLTIEKAPSLSFPVEGKSDRAIRSFFGASRDGGRRRHKGVDIFAAKGTPALAAVKGRITRVYERGIGGKVVWLRADKTGDNLYYAHLDKQLVRPGQRVEIGDTVGLVGKTGNARTTPPHLHFSVYRRGRGAVDPYPFIRTEYPLNASPTGDTTWVGQWVRSRMDKAFFKKTPSKKALKLAELPKHFPIKILAAYKNYFRVELPDGRLGYCEGKKLEALNAAISQTDLPKALPLKESAGSASTTLETLPRSASLDLLATAGDWYLVKNGKNRVGWINIE